MLRFILLVLVAGNLFSGCTTTSSVPEPNYIGNLKARIPEPDLLKQMIVEERTVPPNRGWIRWFNRQSDRVFPKTWHSQDQIEVFSKYNPKGRVQWASNWTRQLDLTGIAWNGEAAGTLITPRHVVFARHYQWKLGRPLVFHDREGNAVRRTLVRKRAIRGRLVDDIMIGVLDKPVPPGIKIYKLFPPASYGRYSLLGTRAVLTNRHRQVVIREINAISRGHSRGRPGHLVRFRAASGIPAFAQPQLTKGDSGHPGFLIYRGDLVLLETLTYGGFGRGPFYGSPEYQREIQRILDQDSRG